MYLRWSRNHLQIFLSPKRPNLALYLPEVTSTRRVLRTEPVNRESRSRPPSQCDTCVTRRVSFKVLAFQVRKGGVLGVQTEGQGGGGAFLQLEHLNNSSVTVTV
jgi:hypothetical protein